MNEKPIRYLYGLKTHLVILLAVFGLFLVPLSAAGETYGLRDAQGNFVPKVTVTIKNKEVLIKKVDPQERFKSFSLTLNPNNRNLIRNVGLIELEWIDSNNQPTKPVRFAGPLYNPETRVFQDSIIKSLGFKLVDKTTTRSLFGDKPVSDFFTMTLDDQPLVSSESVAEKSRTVNMGTGRDVSLNIDKSVIVFNENNFKKGEILNVDNRSGLDQVLGVELPEKGLLYFQIIRKPEQTKIPRENWDKFNVSADSGIFIVLIPEPTANEYARLDGKEITIKVYQGGRVRDVNKIPIKIAADLHPAQQTSSAPMDTTAREQTSRPAAVTQSRGDSTEPPPPARTSSSGPRAEARTSVWIWIIQIFNLVLLVGLAGFGMFFMLPKIQVLQDRLAKAEMFIHGSREAIRDELEQIKGEIIQQCERDASGK